LWLSNYYSEGFRSRLLLEAGEPLIRARYNVYLHREVSETGQGQTVRRRLLYHDATCNDGEQSAQFFLHVYPADKGQLAAERRQDGYDIRDFTLGDHGGRWDGACFAAVDLPEYDVLEIRTGQFDGGSTKAWEGRIFMGQED
jgi:hypothetical protein